MLRLRIFRAGLSTYEIKIADNINGNKGDGAAFYYSG